MGNVDISAARFVIPSSIQKSMVFDGSASKALVPITPDTTGFSMGFWICRRSLTATEHYISCSGGGRTAGFGIVTDGNGNFVFFIYDGSTQVFGNNITVLKNIWTHIVVTWIPGSNNKKIYKNGVLQSSATCSAMGTPGSFYLGCSKDSNLFATEYLKDFTFQNTTTPWTASQVQDLYYRNTIPSGANQWSLNNTNLDQNGVNGLTLTSTSYDTSVPFSIGAPRLSIGTPGIAVDSTANGSVSGTSLTMAHTCSGKYRILLLGLFGDTKSGDASGVKVTGATYNLQPMTLIDKTFVTSDRWIYLFYLINPALGNNNIIVTASSSIVMQGMSASYTAAKQLGVPDASTTKQQSSVTGGTNYTTSITTVLNNCWTVLMTKNSVGTTNASTGSTERAGSGATKLFDSNQSVPTGSTSMSVQCASTANFASIMASFPPYISSRSVASGRVAI